MGDHRLTGSTTKDRKSHLIPLALGVAGLALGAWVAGSLLSGNDWNPSVFIKFPTVSPAELAYGNQMLGEVVPAGGLGHDGKYYFMQAMDPFYVTPEEHAVLLDRPTYRAQRMLYPMLAGGFGFLPATATAWNLLVINVVALGVGTWLTAILAKELGLSAWFGLAFLVNPGVLVSTFIDTADALALVCMLAGALFILKDNRRLAVSFLTLAALSRESMILASVGAIVYLWHRQRHVPRLYLAPFIAMATWWLYLRIRLGHLTDGGADDTQVLGMPFKGFYEAFQIWVSTPGSEVDLIMGFVLLVASTLVAWRAIKGRNLLGLMTAGFAVLAVLMIEQVWRFYFDASRALIPVITVYILTVAASRKESLDTTSSAPRQREQQRH